MSELSAELLTVKEVAAILRVSEDVVYALCDRQELSHLRIGTQQRLIRVPRKLLEEYLASRLTCVNRRRRTPKAKLTLD